MKTNLIVSVLSLLSLFNSQTLKDLLFQKYAKRLSTDPVSVSRINSNGERVLVNIPAPPYLERRTLTNPESCHLLENFENDPEAVYSNQKLCGFVTFRAVKEYDKDSYSRKIITYCLEVGPSQEYIKTLLCEAAKYQVTSLIEYLVEFHNASLVSDENDSFLTDKSFMDTIIDQGNYHLIKHLMFKGYPMDSPDVLVNKICSRNIWINFDAAIDLLEFLMVTTESYDINQQQGYFKDTALILALTCKTPRNDQFENKVNLVRFLIENGSDIYLKDFRGKSALEYAANQGIDVNIA